MDAKHSYVEGEGYTNEIDEVEAMGGDSFFLTDFPEDESATKGPVSSSSGTDNLDVLLESNILLPNGATGIIQQLQQGSLPFVLNNRRKSESAEDDGTFTDRKNREGNPRDGSNLVTDPSRRFQQGTPDRLHSPSPKLDEESFENEMDEILFFGGDPAFVGPEALVREGIDRSINGYEELLESGGDPFFLDETQEETDFTKSLAINSCELVIEKDDGPSQMERLSSLLALTGFDDLAIPDVSESTRIGSSFSVDSNQSLLDEIEAMGGDAFFLDATETTPVEENSEHWTVATTKAKTSAYPSILSDTRCSTDGQGPSPKILPAKKTTGSEWVWDGVVDDEAHMNLE